MELTRAAWLTKQLERRTLTPLVRLSLPMGDRVWGFIAADTSVLVGGFFDADVDFDASVYFDPDGIYLERSARLLTIRGIEQGIRTFDAAVLGSWGQAERPIVTLEVDNGDRVMSHMIGDEYVLNQTGIVYLTFPGLDLLDAHPARTGKVQRWSLNSRRLLLEVSPQ